MTPARAIERLALPAVLLVAAALRVPGISARALWIDEAFCVRLSQFGWGELVERAANDNHPPLFFALLKLWTAVFGTSTLALRSLDLLLGVATVALVHALALRIIGAGRAPDAPRGPVIVGATSAAGWLALQPVHVLWSAQVRMYALSGALAVATALLILRALDRPASWARWGAWTAAAIALVYTHYFGAFVVLAQALHALVVIVRSPDRRAALIRVVAAGLAIAAAFAPWLGVVAAQSQRVTVFWWVPPLTPQRLLWAWSRTAGLLVEDEFTFPSGLAAVCIGVLALVVAAAIATAAAGRDRGLRLAAWCALLPVLGGTAVTLLLGKNVLLARYLVVALVFVPIVIAGMLARWTTPRSAALIAVPLVAALVLALRSQLPVLLPQPDIVAAEAWIEEHRQPGDVLLVHQYYYWSLRIRTAERDPQMRILTLKGRPVQVLGASLVTTDEPVVGPADLLQLRGRVIMVDSERAKVPLPATFHSIESARFATWMPPDPQWTIRVTIYDVR